MKLDHIQLAIPAGSENRCRAFWTGILGCEELAKPEALRARGGAWFAKEDAEIHLGVTPDFIPAQKAHPAFRVDRLDILAEALDAAGHPVRWDDKIKNRRRFFTEDPVGNRIEFMER